MGQLNKRQKEKLDNLVRDKKLFENFNAFLKEHGADDLQLSYFKVEPIGKSRVAPRDGLSLEISHAANGLMEKANFNTFPPLCPHGIPMTQNCSEAGKCKWVCDH